MGIFRRKKSDILDLTERYPTPRKEQEIEVENSPSEKNTSGFGFFSAIANTASSQKDSSDVSESSDERRRRLAKRLMDITNRLEDLSNQIYRLQQRVELLERKADINRF